MPSIVLCAKQMLYPRKDKCSILSHGCIWNVTDNKAVLDPVEINSKNQWNEEECEGEAAVVVELTNVVSIASANKPKIYTEKDPETVPFPEHDPFPDAEL